MASTAENTPLRDKYLRAEPQRGGYGFLRKFVHKLGILLWDDRQSLPNLSDRQARDIGLDIADLAYRRLELPSQSWRHPML
ncbi:MAG: hypothetical protein AB3N11_06500 [Arenibacterium sp.]